MESGLFRKALLTPAVGWEVRALSGRLEFTVRRHKFSQDSLPLWKVLKGATSKLKRAALRVAALSAFRAPPKPASGANCHFLRSWICKPPFLKILDMIAVF